MSTAANDSYDLSFHNLFHNLTFFVSVGEIGHFGSAFEPFFSHICLLATVSFLVQFSKVTSQGNVVNILRYLNIFFASCYKLTFTTNKLSVLTIPESRFCSVLNCKIFSNYLEKRKECCMNITQECYFFPWAYLISDLFKSSTIFYFFHHTSVKIRFLKIKLIKS